MATKKPPASLGSPKCVVCTKPVFAGAAAALEGKVVHKTCFKCIKCYKALMPETHKVHEEKFYCVPHWKEATGQKVHAIVDTNRTDGRSTAPSAPAPPLSQRVFDKYDSDKDGHITGAEFKLMCMEMGYCLSKEEHEMALKVLDKDASGTIEYPEFVEWWTKESRFVQLQLDEDELAFMHKAYEQFMRFDADHGGTISRGEFAALHKFLAEGKYTPQALDAAWAQMDTDSNGVISFNEYVAYPHWGQKQWKPTMSST
eukprot:TRINITY_DN787_c0_g1_i9.p1 TRINITY_DN787_c0_g1~~TRINITY_DN787_c0_g1_i9.p1  ORF type:complete len:269 (-),score=106.88 TRINITY_DN787_c0_g1_i9:124-894(-)